MLQNSKHIKKTDPSMQKKCFEKKDLGRLCGILPLPAECSGIPAQPPRRAFGRFENAAFGRRIFNRGCICAASACASLFCFWISPSASGCAAAIRASVFCRNRQIRRICCDANVSCLRNRRPASGSNARETFIFRPFCDHAPLFLKPPPDASESNRKSLRRLRPAHGENGRAIKKKRVFSIS